MKCPICGKGFKDNERLIPIYHYVTNERRGDFAGGPSEFMHYSHFTTPYNER